MASVTSRKKRTLGAGRGLSRIIYFLLSLCDLQVSEGCSVTRVLVHGLSYGPVYSQSWRGVTVGVHDGGSK